MAVKLAGIPVAVCEDRVEGAEKLINMFSPDIIVLDDAFQHRKIKRDLDVLIINQRDIETGMRIFPVGTLRESKNALKRADFIFMNGDIKEPGIKFDANFRLKFSSVSDVNNEETDPHNKKFVAFSGLANNQSFFNLLSLNGIKAVDMIGFRDHHYYEQRDYEYLTSKMGAMKADAFITTEKDFVKLDKEFKEKNKIFFLSVEIDFIKGEEDFKKRLRSIAHRA